MKAAKKALSLDIQELNEEEADHDEQQVEQVNEGNGDLVNEEEVEHDEQHVENDLQGNWAFHTWHCFWHCKNR